MEFSTWILLNCKNFYCFSETIFPYFYFRSILHLIFWRVRKKKFFFYFFAVSKNSFKIFIIWCEIFRSCHFQFHLFSHLVMWRKFFIIYYNVCGAHTCFEHNKRRQRSWGVLQETMENVTLFFANEFWEFLGFCQWFSV